MRARRHPTLLYTTPYNPRMDLRDYIRDIPDFPQPGILFRDITPLLSAPEAAAYALDQLTARAQAIRPDAIVGIESRGFLFGMPIAARLGLPFVPVRKPGKLPAERKSIDYSLEYGDSRLDIHADALVPGQRALVVDDLLATGGTALATCKLVEMLGANVAGVLFLIELQSLGGRARLSSYDVQALLAYA
jgi:adenine phosphoribosyltransferase